MSVYREPPVVVVADDDAFMRRAVSCLLQEVWAAQVHLASEAGEALTLARRVQPDLIVTDVHMPGMSVLELCQQLRAQAGTRVTPIYLLTGVLAGAPELAQLTPLVQGVLGKPPDPGELAPLLKQLRPDTHRKQV